MFLYGEVLFISSLIVERTTDSGVELKVSESLTPAAAEKYCMLYLFIVKCLK